MLMPCGWMQANSSQISETVRTAQCISPWHLFVYLSEERGKSSHLLEAVPVITPRLPGDYTNYSFHLRLRSKVARMVNISGIDVHERAT